MDKSIIMKNLNYLLSSAMIIAGLFLLYPNQGYGQKAVKKLADPIPENVFKIFEKSCMGCHATNGNSIAKSMLNFDKWQQLKPKKAIKKAGSICSAVSSEFMPPKSVRKAKPELLPSKTDIEAICKWAESLKPPVTPKK